MQIDSSKRLFITSGLAAATGAAAILSAPAAAAPRAASGVLAGRVALVTGAARGIGRAIADLFAAQGAHIAMVDLADPAKLNSSAGYRIANMTEFDAAIAAVRRHGTRVLKIQADVRDFAAMQAAAKRTAAELGGIDIVVANAGYVNWHPFEEGTPETWRDVVDVNVHGVFNTSAAAIPMLKKSRHARIINMASIGGRIGAAGNGAYTSTKWAVIGMTKQAAAELGVHGISVNAVAPGAVNTPMYRSAGQMKSMGVSSPAQQDRIIDPVSPLGDKAAVEPEDIAATALFLASDAAKTISGTVVDNALGYNASYSA
jgi:NAD(P)-dependent dehydrogenase (short-subunit alcohol dehydrogenase family)